MNFLACYWTILFGVVENLQSELPLVKDHVAGWNIPMLNRKYIFIHNPFSIGQCLRECTTVGCFFQLIFNVDAKSNLKSETI